jgi:aldose 1-epimerase
MKIDKQPFGKLADGREVDIYTIETKSKMVVKVINYGGIVVSLEVPDRRGKFADVVLGFDKIEDYVKSSPYFGCITGRCANRIAKGKFTLEGKEYTLATNNGPNHLHGGIVGFDKVIWQTETFENADELGLKFTHVSKDGDEGYPGNLNCTVIYTFTNNNEFKIDYTATTDKTTICNLTHHSYFNLSGHGDGDILSHEMMINADRYTPVNDELIPTGKIQSVRNSPLDFTKSTRIGARIAQVPGGYDHNYVLNNTDGSLYMAARAFDPASGRVMDVYTTEPAIQLYTGNFLDGSFTGKGGKVYRKNYGFCLETQHYPDSINQPNFPSVVLSPGKTYKHECVYKFYSRNK